MLISINNGQLKIGAKEEQSLRDALLANEIKIGVCGGRGICGKCKLKVQNCKQEFTEAEKKKLSEQEISEGFRLACQIEAVGGMEISLPDDVIDQQDFSAVCTKITPLTSDVRMFRFDMKDSQTLDYIPGQYVQLTTPSDIEGYPSVTRTFSIASDPSDKSYFELIIKRTPNGNCTRYLFEKIEEGTELEFMGPDGDFRLTCNDSPMIFIAGGSGMSAIRCLLMEMRRTNCKRKTTYFFGAPTPEGLYMLDEMSAFENELSEFKFVPCVQTDPACQWKGAKGLVTQVVSSCYDKCNEAEAYLCGAPGMINASIPVLETIGVDKSRIYYDSFG
ncbi:MAG: NADH:ubiquinone reductase (Na(+)-transporting) subunit F [Sedimentisphaeraceae bacterium JB056]